MEGLDPSPEPVPDPGDPLGRDRWDSRIQEDLAGAGRCPDLHAVTGEAAPQFGEPRRIEDRNERPGDTDPLAPGHYRYPGEGAMTKDNAAFRGVRCRRRPAARW